MSVNQERVQGITENDIADYLANTPAFFERHAELLASIQLASPHGGRAVSLQERQMDMLRERIKGLERRWMDMVRAGNDNAVTARRVHQWTCEVLRADAPAALYEVLVHGLADQFLIPQVALRVWGVQPDGLPWTTSVSEDAKAFAASLTLPYCGVNAAFDVAAWLDEPVLSMAMIPLRSAPHAKGCFGMLVLGSPDATRYQSDMGTEFLDQVGDLAGAAVARLLGLGG